MATTKGKTRIVDISDLSTAEAVINAQIEVEEALGFVLAVMEPKILTDTIGGIKRAAVLSFVHQDYAPGGTGSGGVPFKELVLNLTPTELTDAALTQAFSFASPPANALFLGGEVEVKTVGSGGGVAALTAELGDAGNTDEYCTAQDLLTTGHKFVAGAKLASGPSIEVAYVPSVLVTSDVNVDTLTGLEINARLFYIDLPDTP